MPTAQKILNLLNRRAMRVSELAAALGVSRNSAYVQIAKLEATGAVDKIRPEATSTVGKPAFQYRTASRHEDTFSAAYKAVIGSLVEAIGDRLPEPARIELLEEAGRLLADAAGLASTTDFDSDLQRALDAVNALGAMAEVAGSEPPPTIRCHTCPIATLVHKDPTLCHLVASFFSAATGRPVAVQCRRDRTVVCGFSFHEAMESGPEQDPQQR